MKIVAAEIDSVGNDIDYSILQDLGEVTFYPDKITDANAAERLKGVSVLAINKTGITEEILKQAPDLKLICEFATGFDNANIAACSAHGIKVANVKDYSSASVAQHTFAMYFYLLENLRHYDEFVKSGAYGAQEHFSCLDIPFSELDGQTWGIVGMGNIGKRVAKAAQAFGAHVIFYASSGHSDCTDYEQVSFEELLSRSDVISLHCPLSEETADLMNRKAFAQMKPSAYLLNVARGPVINEQDLYDALVSGRIRGAGLDVLSAEPIAADNPLAGIRDSGRLLITPHMAWASTQARRRCVSEVRENILAWQRGENRNVVNEPRI